MLTASAASQYKASARRIHDGVAQLVRRGRTGPGGQVQVIL